MGNGRCSTTIWAGENAKEIYSVLPGCPAQIINADFIMIKKKDTKDRNPLTQINLVLVCGADSNLPTLIHSIEESVKDAKTLFRSIEEIHIKEK